MDAKETETTYLLKLHNLSLFLVEFKAVYISSDALRVFMVPFTLSMLTRFQAIVT